jgi:hypothetical protein
MTCVNEMSDLLTWLITACILAAYMAARQPRRSLAESRG